MKIACELNETSNGSIEFEKSEITSVFWKSSTETKGKFDRELGENPISVYMNEFVLETASNQM